MSLRDFFGLVVVLMVGCLAPAFSFAADSGLDDPLAGSGERQVVTRDTPWTIEELAGNIGAFSHVSVAADGPSGSVYISYYDAVDGDLWWARTVDSGGNCGPGNTWLCESLYTSGSDVGMYSSIAVKPSGQGVTFLVPFYDATSERLMLADGYVAEGTLTMVVGVIDSGFIATDRTGMYTAVQYDSNGVPWIAYQNETYDLQVGVHRMIAQYVGDGSGNCGEGLIAGDWDCQDLFANGYSQSFSSTGMAIDDQNRPVVAFYDEHENDPVVARYLGSGGNCGPSNTWQCYEVSPQAGDTDTGKHVVPFVGDGSTTLFYQNSSQDVLERANYVYPAPGNCGWSDGTTMYEWQCITIDNMDGIFMERGISVAADAAGYPVVTYQYGLDPGPAGLGVARPVASPEVGSGAGNCGPGNSWYCQIIDSGATLREADSVSIAVGQWGEGIIAYEEVDYYPFPAEHNLKLATLSMPGIFFDGFESGHTLEWSSTFGGVGPFSITQSIDPKTIVGGALHCAYTAPGSPNTQNQWLRRFRLAADHGITHAIDISSIDWAIGRVDLFDVGSPIATVNIYALANGAAFTYANMGAPIGTVAVPLAAGDAGTFVNCAVTGSIVDPTATDLVVEFVMPDGSSHFDLWRATVGQNGGGEIRNSYIAAADCLWDEPTSFFAAFGEESETLVLRVNGVAQAPLKATKISNEEPAPECSRSKDLPG